MLDYLNDTELDRTVLYVVLQHRGRENAIPRWEFVERIFGHEAVIEPLRNNNNVWDRQLRDSLERLRAQGHHIANMGGGYYMAMSRAEYEEWKRSYMSQAYRKLQIEKAMDDEADKRWGLIPRDVPAKQMSMSEVMA